MLYICCWKIGTNSWLVYPLLYINKFICYSMRIQGFSYFSEVSWICGKKHSDLQNWENLMQIRNIFVALIVHHKNSLIFACFLSHFYANFLASVTLLFVFGFSWNFHQSVVLRNWELYAPFWEVFAQFWIRKGPICSPKSGLRQFLEVIYSHLRDKQTKILSFSVGVWLLK